MLTRKFRLSRTPSGKQRTAQSLIDTLERPLVYMLHSCNLVGSRHCLQLVCTRDTRYPFNALWHIQLNRRLGLRDRVQIIHYPNLDDLGVPKGLAITPKRGATVAAEVRSDGLARVCFLGNGLGASAGHFETVARDDDVGAVGGAGNLAAVEAVAESLA